MEHFAFLSPRFTLALDLPFPLWPVLHSQKRFLGDVFKPLPIEHLVPHDEDPFSPKSLQVIFIKSVNVAVILTVEQTYVSD